MENTFESKALKILDNSFEPFSLPGIGVKEIDEGFIFNKRKAVKEITALHDSELSKRDELIEVYKELTFVLNQLADYEINKDNTDKAFQLRLKISELTKELGKI